MKISEIEMGHIYKVTHSRKGTFTVQAISQNDEWFTGVIVEGQTRAMLDYNVRYEGEEVTMRKSFITAINEVLPADQLP